jgi:hypothetical protein
MLINGSDPIDAESVNDVYKAIDKVKDKLIHLMWRNSRGENDKTVKSLDGKQLQVIAGSVPVNSKTAKDDEVSYHVKFFNSFGGKKAPTVVAMPQSASPYGVSVKNVDSEGFDLVVHQFPDGPKDERLTMNAIHYIAVGMP